MARPLPHHRECESQSHISRLHPLPHTRLTAIVFAWVFRASEHISCHADLSRVLPVLAGAHFRDGTNFRLTSIEQRAYGVVRNRFRFP